MTGSLTRTQAVVLGLVVVVGLCLGAIGLFAIGDRQGLWVDHFTLFVRFKQVGGIEVGTRVRVQGVNAGQVTALEQPAERGGDVLVRLQLDSRFQPLIGSDARAEILSEGLIGGKVLEIDPGTPGTAAVEPGAVLPGRADNVMAEVQKLAGKSQQLMGEIDTLTRQTQEAMAEAHGLIREVRQGQGIMGKELIATLKQSQQTMDSMERGFDALKNLPFVGRYVDNSTDLLVRPTAERHAFVFKESELFEPNRGVLTADGQQRLDQLAAKQLPRLKVYGSEIVIAAYTDAAVDARAAEILTQQQSDAVRTYLVEEHQVNRLSWWRRRDVTALGMGNRTPRGEAAAKAPPSRRVEVLVFVPPGSVQ